MTEFEKGYQKALEDMNTPMFVPQDETKPSECPRCRKSFEKYEEKICSKPEGDIWEHATELERCPYCGQKIVWRGEQKKGTKSQFKNMELGNLMFGHSRGAYYVSREELEPMFSSFLENHDIDAYGEPLRKSKLSETSNWDDNIACETDMFIIRPYYCGEDKRLQGLPNFVYKPENIEIRWYKYPFRDSYSNVPLREEKLREILKNCHESIKEIA